MKIPAVFPCVCSCASCVGAWRTALHYETSHRAHLQGPHHPTRPAPASSRCHACTVHSAVSAMVKFSFNPREWNSAISRTSASSYRITSGLSCRGQFGVILLKPRVAVGAGDDRRLRHGPACRPPSKSPGRAARRWPAKSAWPCVGRQRLIPGTPACRRPSGVGVDALGRAARRCAPAACRPRQPGFQPVASTHQTRQTSKNASMPPPGK